MSEAQAKAKVKAQVKCLSEFVKRREEAKDAVFAAILNRIKATRGYAEAKADEKALAEMPYWKRLLEKKEVKVFQKNVAEITILYVVTFQEILMFLSQKHPETFECTMSISTFFKLIRETPALQREIDDFVYSEASEAERINAI